MNDHSYLKALYTGRNEDERFASQSGQVEFLTTMRYIERFLKPGARVIEIGAGTGRYSRALAEMGCAVDALELLECNIDIFRTLVALDSTITISQGDALDLSAFADDSYDIALLLGPLYHLFTQSDKRRAIGEALRVTKPGGVVFAAYCISDASVVASGFFRGRFSVPEYIEQGLIHPETFACSSNPSLVFEIVRKEDIDALMEPFRVERLHYVASDLYTYYIRDIVNAMDGETFSLYMRYHFAVCERADMTGVTAHSLDIFRKI